MPNIHIPTDASPLRAVKYDRQNAVLRVRGCRVPVTKIQAQLFYGMQTQRGVLFRGLLVVQK